MARAFSGWGGGAGWAAGGMVGWALGSEMAPAVAGAALAASVPRCGGAVALRPQPTTIASVTVKDATQTRAQAADLRTEGGPVGIEMQRAVLAVGVEVRGARP